MRYSDIRFIGPVRLGERDGNYYAAGPLLEIRRDGDTVTLEGPDSSVDVPWSSVLFATRTKDAPAPAEPSRTARKGR